MHVYFSKDNEPYVCPLLLKEENKNMHRSCSHGHGHSLIFLISRVINLSNHHLHIHVPSLLNGP